MDDGEITIRDGQPEIAGKRWLLGTRQRTGGNEGPSSCQTTGQGAYERLVKPKEGGFAGRERRRTFLGELGVM